MAEPLTDETWENALAELWEVAQDCGYWSNTAKDGDSPYHQKHRYGAALVGRLADYIRSLQERA